METTPQTPPPSSSPLPPHHPHGLHPHGPMRRRDREITDRAEIDEIIRTTQVMHLALADGPNPFVVPLFFAYDGTAIYFHSASQGTKIEILKRNNNVCVEFSQPHGVIPNEIPCDFEARHRTVIATGKAIFVTDAQEKADALDKIVARFTSQKFTYPPGNFSQTTVVRIVLDSVKGKKHGY